jgi:predicted DNA-binding protein (UPF0251 family)
MARPINPRRVCCRFSGQGYRPLGRPAFDLPVTTVALDELEALRLADVEGLYQEAAAERMGVSRPTFARILTRARRAVAEALVSGRVLVFETGPVVRAPEEPIPCPVHGGGRRRGRGCLCADRHPREEPAAGPRVGRAGTSQEDDGEQGG